VLDDHFHPILLFVWPTRLPANPPDVAPRDRSSSSGSGPRDMAGLVHPQRHGPGITGLDIVHRSFGLLVPHVSLEVACVDVHRTRKIPGAAHMIAKTHDHKGANGPRKQLPPVYSTGTGAFRSCRDLRLSPAAGQIAEHGEGGWASL
jgi:hypothetical protein